MADLDFLKIPLEISGLDPVNYHYFDQLINKRTILFNGEVSEDLIETVFVPLRDFENDDSNAPITLILNSPGGSVSDGFFFANYLTTFKKKLNIIVTGYAASMAAVILAGGGKNPNITRYGYPSTYALIHDGYVAIAASESKTASDIMEYNTKVDNEIRKFIIDNTNITEELYDSKTRHQWFLDAKECKELGLLDKIYGCDE